jgi:hypothetical protein
MVISRLRNRSEYDDIRVYINDNLGKNTFYYSKAHIFDLMNDKSDEKYLDLEFIEKNLGNNYLLKSFNQPTKLFNVPAKEAFQSELEDDNDVLSNIDDLFENELYGQIDKIIDFPISFPFKIDLDSVDMPIEYKTYLKNLINCTSFKELIANQDDFQNSMNENKVLFKYIRSTTKNNQNLFLVDNYSDFNLLEDRIFIKNNEKMTFLEYIDSWITVQTDNEEEKYYYRFCMGYSILNSLGLDSECNKKANFKNTSNDGLHAFYASYCDLLVTNDSGIKEKAKIIYKLFDIKTTVIDPIYFIDYIN